MTHETNDGGHAFPQLNSTGMTLRDWFAGQVLAGGLCKHGEPYDGRGAAQDAYIIADWMIEARKG